MLEALRKWAGGWVAGVFILLLAGSFAVWGVGDMMRGGFSTVAATVGSTELDANAFLREFNRERRRLSQQFQRDISPSEARLMGLDNIVLARLTDEMALNEEARYLGMETPDTEVIKAIRNDPGFRDFTGKFNRLNYEAALQQIGISEQAYTQNLRRQITRLQIVQTIATNTPAPRPLVKLLNDFAYEKRSAEYIVIGPEDVTFERDIPETEATAYLQQNEALFTAPEYRQVTILNLRPEDLIDLAGVTDEQVRQAYEARAAEFTQSTEKRTIEQFLFTEETAAREGADILRTALSTGEEDFTAAVAELGFDSDIITLGEVEIGDLPEPQASTAFDMTDPGLSDVVQTPLGWAIIRVRAIAAPAVTPFEQVEAQIRRDLLLAQAQTEIYDFSNVIDDDIAGGLSLEEVASKNSLALTRALIDSRGFTNDGIRQENLPANTAFFRDLFATVIGNEESLQTTDDGGYYIFRLDGITPAALKPLAEVRAEVDTAIRLERQSAAQDELVAENLERAREITGLAALGEETGSGLESVSDFLRTDSPAPFSQALVTNLFKTKIDRLTAGPSADGASRIIARLTAISPPSGEEAIARFEARRNQLGQGVENDLIAQFIGSLKAKHGVTQDPAVIDALFEATGGFGNFGGFEGGTSADHRAHGHSGH